MPVTSTCSHCGMRFDQDDPKGPRRMCPECRRLARELAARRDPSIGAARMRVSRAKAISDTPTIGRGIPILERALGDPLTFRDAHCTDDSRGRIPVSELWARYQHWCGTERLVPLKRQDFVEQVLGYEYGLSASSPKSVVGLRWKEQREI